MGHQLSASARIDAPPEAVFARITDLAALPDWNDGIAEVVEAPPALAPGAVWKVRIRAMGTSWVSRSEVLDLDMTAHRFAYRSQSDDGNPSHADWSWHVTADGKGSRVEVAVDVHPKTFFRKHIAIRLRKPGLRKEMHVSLAQLAESVMA